jgi:hypothetical protein
MANAIIVANVNMPDNAYNIVLGAAAVLVDR